MSRSFLKSIHFLPCVNFRLNGEANYMYAIFVITGTKISSFRGKGISLQHPSFLVLLFRLVLVLSSLNKRFPFYTHTVSACGEGLGDNVTSLQNKTETWHPIREAFNCEIIHFVPCTTTDNNVEDPLFLLALLYIYVLYVLRP